METTYQIIFGNFNDNGLNFRNQTKLKEIINIIMDRRLKSLNKIMSSPELILRTTVGWAQKKRQVNHCTQQRQLKSLHCTQKSVSFICIASNCSIS